MRGGCEDASKHCIAPLAPTHRMQEHGFAALCMREKAKAALSHTHVNIQPVTTDDVNGIKRALEDLVNQVTVRPCASVHGCVLLVTKHAEIAPFGKSNRSPFTLQYFEVQGEGRYSHHRMTRCEYIRSRKRHSGMSQQSAYSQHLLLISGPPLLHPHPSPEAQRLHERSHGPH